MTRCPQCNQNKRYDEFGRRTDYTRHAICNECYVVTQTKLCKRCGEIKILAEFHRAGPIFSGWCMLCDLGHFNKYRPSERTLSISTDHLPDGVALGDSTTWQHCTPAHLPPIVLAGRVVGTMGGRLVAQVAGALFVVEGK